MSLGIDLVDVNRLRRALDRSSRLEARLFTKREQKYCTEKADPVVHFAGTLAAKEAVIKALDMGRLVECCGRIEIARLSSGAPRVTLDGEPIPIEISITHDGPMAAAVAVGVRPPA